MFTRPALIRALPCYPHLLLALPAVKQHDAIGASDRADLEGIEVIQQYSRPCLVINDLESNPVRHRRWSRLIHLGENVRSPTLIVLARVSFTQRDER